MDLVELGRRLGQQGFAVERPGGALLVASKKTFRLRWMATSLTVFVVARAVPRTDLAAWMAHEQAAAALAAARWKGMRGMQKGYAVMPILLTPVADAQALQVVAGPMGLEFARFTVRALRLPGEVVSSRFPRVVGSIYNSYLRGLVASLLA
jgi:hypothetical protein